jgi:hypothetical protein
MIRSLFTSADEKRSTIGGDDDHSRVLVGKMADQGVGPRDDSHGQAVGRFMEDDDAWHLCQASANPHLLLIAARQCHYALTFFGQRNGVVGPVPRLRFSGHMIGKWLGCRYISVGRCKRAFRWSRWWDCWDARSPFLPRAILVAAAS